MVVKQGGLYDPSFVKYDKRGAVIHNSYVLADLAISLGERVPKKNKKEIGVGKD